jgi:hypothetical protein
LLPYWINGGFMLFERSVLDLMAGDDVNLETDVLTTLAQQNQLMIYRHDGFWQSMNTMKDTLLLEKIWQENPPWKVGEALTKPYPAPKQPVHQQFQLYKRLGRGGTGGLLPGTFTNTFIPPVSPSVRP